MPHRRLPSAGTCEVVPAGGEPPCPQRAFGDRPRLCAVHRKEYGKLTAQYKATSEDAERLYKEVGEKDWTDTALWNTADVDGALVTAAACVDTIEREIREREEHHGRFFVERHDGHEAWLQRLRKKLREVDAVRAQLVQCKNALAQDQRRRAEERRREEELRASAARRVPANSPRLPRTRVAASSTYTYDKEAGYFRAVPSNNTPPKAPRVTCIAYLPDLSCGHSLRCEKEVLRQGSRCSKHEIEYFDASYDLGEAKAAQSAMHSDMDYVCRLARSNCTPSITLAAYIADVKRYISLLDKITTSRETQDRLDGHRLRTYPGVGHMLCGPTRQTAQDALAILLASQASPEAAAQTRVNPPRESYRPQPEAGRLRPEEPRSTPSDDGIGIVGALGAAAAAVFIGVRFLFGGR